jgi:hypothetical protein
MPPWLTFALVRAGYPRSSEVHPTRQYTNLNLLVNGLPVILKAAHAKVRRGGYRRTR